MEWMLLILAAAVAVACASLRLMFGALSEARRLRADTPKPDDPDDGTQGAALVEALAEARADAEGWRRANQSRIAFLDRLGPELRGPLNAIAGFAELMRARSAEEPLGRRQAQAVDQIIAGADRLHDIVEEAADLARLEAGRLTLFLEKADPSLIARQACEALRHRAEAAGVILTPPPARPGVAVIADRERLRQLIGALIGAALGRSPAGATLTPELREEGEMLVLTLRDEGPALSEAALSALLEPFGGPLATASRLALAMGGELEIESPPGGGAVMRLSLRLALTAPVEAVSPTPLGAATILYVEGDAPSQALMRHLVPMLAPPTAGPLTLHVAETGCDGLALARDLRPDVVLLNMTLPDMDGFQVRTRLRDDPLTAAIPVLAVSSRASEDEMRRGRKAGFAAFLMKPLHRPILAATLVEALAESVRRSQSESAAGGAARRGPRRRLPA